MHLMMTGPMRWLMFLPLVAQIAALAIQLHLGAPSPYGLYAQFAALAVMLVVYGAAGIQRFRFLRRRYADIKRRRADQAARFDRFIDSHARSSRRH
jgi:hypothetical protein